MMLYDVLTTLQKYCSFFSCEETFAFFKAKMTLADENIEVLENVVDSLKDISYRDRINFHFVVNDNAINGNSCEEITIDKFQDHFAFHRQDEINKIIFDFTINKNVNDGTISVYWLAKFIEFVANSNLQNVFANFYKVFNEYLIFEVYQEIDSFESSTIKFQPYPLNENKFIRDRNRQATFNKIIENVNIQGGDLQFLPSDFHLNCRSSDTKINGIFDSLCSVLSIFSIANYSEFCNDNYIKFRVNGYRSIITEKKKYGVFGELVDFTYEIFRWVYHEGECSDKLGLVRNVLSLHLDDKREIKFNKDSLNAIRSNYQIYLKGNVSNYMEIKSKVTEYVLDSSSKIYQMCDSFLENFKNNIISIITFIVTAVVISGISGGDITKMFSPVFVYLVVFLSFLSIVWLILIYNDTNQRYQQLKNSTLYNLKANYSSLLIESEIDGIVDPVMTKNGDYLNQRVKFYVKIWVFNIVIFIITFLGGMFVFGEKEVQGHEISYNNHELSHSIDSLLSSHDIIINHTIENPISQKKILKEEN